MSLFKKIGKFAGRLAKNKLVQGALGVVPGGAIVKGIGMGASVLGGARAAQKLLPRAMPGTGALVASGGKLAKIGKGVVRVGGAAATGAVLYDAVGNVIGQRRKVRRMNPLNYRALNRAIKRVCKAKDLTDRLDNITIKRTMKRRASC